MQSSGDNPRNAPRKIVDPNGDEDFAIFGFVDLTEPIAEDAPLVTLRRIGT